MSQTDDILKESHAQVSAWRVWSRFIGYYGPYKGLFFGDLLAATVPSIWPSRSS